MNNNSRIEWLNKCLDALFVGHEIYILYGKYKYSVEPKIDNKYSVFESDVLHKEKSIEVATFSDKDEFYSLKCFDGQKILEILNDIKEIRLH